MESNEDFAKHWRKRYPEISPPILSCLNVIVGPNKTNNINNQQTKHNYNTDIIQDEIHKRQCHISKLQYQIEQEEFVVKYLWDTLNKRDYKERFSQSHLGRVNEGDEYRNIPQQNISNDKYSVTSPSAVQNVVSSHVTTDVSKKLSGPEHMWHLNDNSRKKPSPGDSGLNTVQQGMSHVPSNIDQDRDDSSSNINTSSLLSQTYKGASFSGSPKPSVKPRTFSKSASLSEKRGSNKSRPPVPAPRPSTKGPTYKSRVSFAVESPTTPESSPILISDTVSPGHENFQEMKRKFEPEKMTKPSVESGLTGTITNQESGQIIDKLPQTIIANLPLLAQGPVTQRSESPKQTFVHTDIKQNERSSTHIFLDGTTGRESSTDMEMEPDELLSTPIRPPRRVSELSQIQQMDISTDRSSTSTTEDIAGSDDAEISSDEEAHEPIYFNMQELIQKSLTMDNSSLYKTMKTNAQKEKRALERAARRLTQRITMQELGQAYKLKEAEDDNSSVDDNLEDEPGESKHTFSFNDTPDPSSSDRDTPERDTPEESNRDETWRKRTSMQRAIGEETDSIASMEEMHVNMATRSIYRESDQLQMRRWVVTSILASEQEYTKVLDVMHQYMNSFKAAAKTCQPLISEEDTKKIFFKVPELLKIHQDFVKSLEPLVENWQASTEVGNVVKTMLSLQLPIAEVYLKHYHKSIATIHKCSQENQTFQALAQEIRFPGMTEKLSLEELLHKPVVRVQRNTLVLHDLIKCTPASHADYNMLKNALNMAQHFLENFESPDGNKLHESSRHIVKNSFIVEKVGSHRKLRHVFLFNDVIACAKQKIGARDKVQFECKWFIRLENLKIDTKVSVAEEKKLLDIKRDVGELQRKVSSLKKELKSEVRKSRISDRDRNWSFRGSGRNIEKIKKRLAEQETLLLLSSPNLVFRLQNKSKKQYTFLMTSDYERKDWSDAIKALQTKGQVNQTTPVTIAELQSLMNDESHQPKMNDLGTYLMKEDIDIEDDHLTGSLLITVHSLIGLKSPCDTYTSMEVDTFGHFFMKARTSPCWKSKEPKWNEDFDIELDGAQTLRILAYKKGPNDDVLLGRCALELSRAWLRGDFQEQNVSLNEEISVVVSLRYATRAQTLKRHPSSLGSGLFGVNILKVTLRENSRIPNIVTACIEEVRRRGMDEVGIYRVSGLNGEIQKIKKAFDRSVKGALPHLREADINVVTGVLKSYFRELPQPLFTEDLYMNFVEGVRLNDPESKKQCMISLMKKVPDPSFTTVMFLLDHLVEVASKSAENKMSISNLATVFGPTLLRPAIGEEELGTMESFMAGARDAMMQSAVLVYYLNLRKDGETFHSEK